MANDVLITAHNDYEVKQGKPVKLSVTIGDAQVGGTSLTWKGNKHPFDDESDTAQIGEEGQDISYTLLRCVTTVTDINPATNKTSVTYKLEGGEESKEFPYSAEVKKDSGSAVYVVSFLFTLA